ncbi:MAG: EpsI family protein, partial [Desulfobacterales bacterium]
FFEKSRWKQTILVIATVPIAIIANALRIGITGFLAQKFSLHAADSFFHGFSGWLLFVFSLGLLFVLYYALRVLIRDRSEANTTESGDAHQSVDSISRNNKMHVLGSAVILVLAGILNYATAALPPLKLATGFANFPLSINGWQGRPEIMAPEIIRLSGAEDAFNGIYASDDNEVVSLYIGYRGSPFTESENFFHSPDVCLPSVGWKTLTSADHKVTGVPKFNHIVVRKMLIEKMGQRQLVYYWFQTKSRVSPNVNINRLHLALHALYRDNTYDLFIRPMAPLGTRETVAGAQNKLDQFVREMMGVLLNFVSNNQRIR